MQKTNKTRYAILGMLTISPMSGYDIKKMTDKSIGFFWNENFGHIYPVLKGLEKDGLATRQASQTGARPQKNVYAITEKGEKELESWLKEPVARQRWRNELLLKLFFGRHLAGDTLIARLEKERKENEALLEEYDTIEQFISQMSYRDVPYWMITLRYGIAFSKMTIAWCDETIAEMQCQQKGIQHGKAPGNDRARPGKK